jgi:hypothetical protein
MFTGHMAIGMINHVRQRMLLSSPTALPFELHQNEA